MIRKMNRRDFIIKGSSAVFGTGFALRSGHLFEDPARSASRIVEVFHPGAVGAGRKIDETAVRLMVRKGLDRLTGGASKPWTEFVKPSDRIGLKINTLGRPALFTHHELIRAVVADLEEFGVPSNHILIWDRYETHMKDCGFEFNTGDKGVRVYGTDSLDPAVRRYDEDVIFESDRDNSQQRENGTISRFSSIFTRECDKIINMAILKDHGLSGVTMTLKNLAYGLCDNNRRFHGPEYIGPFIAGFCAHPLVRKKTVLHMVDGLEACYDQGPAPRNPRLIFAPEKLWLGTDPVALDAIGRGAIDEKRKAEGLSSIRDSGRAWDHIELAADKGLGICDLNRIVIDKVVTA